MKRIISVILSIIMILSIFGTLDFPVSAETHTSGEYEYIVLDDGTAEITKYKGSETEITVPNTLDGYDVTSIGKSAFRYSYLTDIRISNRVTKIGIAAFSGCKYLSNVMIPNSVTVISDSAFNSCSSLIHVSVPDSVTSIDRAAFSWCDHLESISLSKRLTVISNDVLSYCKNLKQLIIPKGVKSIGYHAFAYCQSLKNITLPEGVTSIGRDAFINCTALESIIIPKSVTTIYNSAFQNCTALSSAYYDGYKSDLTVEYNNTALTKVIQYSKAKTYVVQYQLCGGSGDFPNQFKTEGIDLKLNTTRPTHNSYSFLYWLSSDRKTTYYEGSIYKADANDILYAVWKEKCSKCNGTQYSSITKCNTCNGKGTITTKYTCTGCKGTGKRTKTSTVTCSNCNGNGTYYGYGLSITGKMGWQYLQCPICNATGKVKKEEQVSCKTCGGDGITEAVTKCTNCQGAGQFKTKCDQCEGKGFIYHYPNHYIDLDPNPYPNPDPTLTLGDVDGDSDITIIDATCIQRHLAELTVTSYHEDVADADGDSDITIMDATAIQRFVAELPTHDGIGEAITK